MAQSRYPDAFKHITFNEVWLVDVHDTNTISFMEPLIDEGEEFKLTLNTGEILKDSMICELSEERQQELLSFSHWFAEVHDAQIGLADLQGIGDILMDPTLITGSTLDPTCELFCGANFKTGAIDVFLRDHKCNDTCKIIGLKECLGYNNPYEDSD